MNAELPSRETRDLPRLPRRAPDSHKGDFGRVLVVAGSFEMPGAAILCARAALRAGAGLVTVATDARLSPALAAACPEATQVLLSSEDIARVDAGDLRAEDFDRGLAERLSAATGARFDAIAVGPGLGTSTSGGRIVAHALAIPRPAVVDADALNWIASHGSQHAAASLASAERIYTPHPGELERLSGERPRGALERRRAAAALATRLGGVAVLKGARSVVADTERHFVNPTGNPGMATGGSGDVLTGIIAGLLAQGLAAFDSAVLGVYLHGLAGDLAARRLGETSLLPSDLIEWLPRAFRWREGVHARTLDSLRRDSRDAPR